jgi:hypothetical protein
MASISVPKLQFERIYMNAILVKDSKSATLLLRVGLGVGFLSAVGDLLGLWGALGNRMSNGGISLGS